MAEVRFERATRRFPGSGRPAVDELNLTISDGEFMVLVGPSGCGKTTSLRMVAGLEELDSGSISIGGRDVTAVPPKKRDIAMVFQSYALYPHMTVRDNMSFALRIAGVTAHERARRVAEASKLLDLEELLGRKPKALSGGQRQRVAMGRAIVRNPQVFLMDEPLSNLDAKLRASTRAQLAELQRRLGVTTIYVTHDQAEAMTMGDRVAVMKDGVLQQVDVPLKLYEKPANVFVAGFVGSPAMNIETYDVFDGHAQLKTARIPLSDEERSVLTREGLTSVVIGVRPESLELVADGEGFAVDVALVEELGSHAFAHCSLESESLAGGGESSHRFVVEVNPRKAPRKGDRVSLRARPGERHFFHPVSGNRLSSLEGASPGRDGVATNVRREETENVETNV